ncbi:MAG: PrsW family glutamic-type intramembrane protease [Candidatus Anstonellaceae archaeon]
MYKKSNFVFHNYNRILFFLIFFVFFSSFIFAQEAPAQKLERLDFSYGLKHNISIEPTKFLSSPLVVNVTIQIFNDYDRDLIIYLYYKNESSYYLEQILGVAPKNKSSVFKFYFVTQYNNERFNRMDYAIVAKGYEVPLGFYFSIPLNWSDYETQKYLEILNNSRFLIPLSGVLILFLISLIILVNFHFSHSTKKLNILDFLFFDLKKFSLEFLISNPLLWVFYLIASFIIFNFVYQEITSFSVILLLVFLLSLLVVILFFSLFWFYSIFVEKLEFRYIIGGFFWGIFSAFLVLFPNSLLVSNGSWLNLFFTISFVIPLLEEFFKSLGIIFLSGKKDFSILNAFFVGLSIGFGFAFVENFLVFSSHPAAFWMGEFSWAWLITYKAFFGFLTHGAFTSIFGFIFFWLRDSFFKNFKIILFFVCLLLVFTLHSFFNLSSSLDGIKSKSVGFYYLEYTPVISLILLGATLIFLFLATLDSKYSILKKII